MSDDLKNRGAQDRTRISLSQDHEVRYWTKALGVSKEQLAALVHKVGNSAEVVSESWVSKPAPSSGLSQWHVHSDSAWGRSDQERPGPVQGHHQSRSCLRADPA